MPRNRNQKTERPTRLVTVVYESERERRELRQQEYGNCNYFFRDIVTGRHTGEKVTYDYLGTTLTVFTKDSSCGRGEYAEEIDVEVSSSSHRSKKSQAKAIAQIVLQHEYEEGLRVSKVVERFGIFW